MILKEITALAVQPDQYNLSPLLLGLLIARDDKEEQGSSI